MYLTFFLSPYLSHSRTVASRLAQRGKQVFKANDKSYDISISLHHEEVDVEKVKAVLTFIKIQPNSVIPQFGLSLSWRTLFKSFPFHLLTPLRSCCVCRWWWTTGCSRVEKTLFCFCIKIFQALIWSLMIRKTTALWKGPTARFSPSAACCWNRWTNRYHS